MLKRDPIQPTKGFVNPAQTGKEEIEERKSIPIVLEQMEIRTGLNSSFGPIEDPEYKLGDYREEFPFNERKISLETSFSHQNFESSFNIRETIPSVADIFPIEVRSASNIHLPKNQERNYEPSFTPYLLPNPISYYNPLNPPLVRPYQILRPSLYNASPLDSNIHVNLNPFKIPNDLQNLSAKQEPKIQTSTISSHFQLVNSQISNNPMGITFEFLSLSGKLIVLGEELHPCGDSIGLLLI